MSFCSSVVKFIKSLLKMCVLKYSYLLVGVLVLVGGGYSAEDSSDSGEWTVVIFDIEKL